jgi:20S proteasome alpha/beta subunit
MTLPIALLGKDGVLIASDTRVVKTVLYIRA